MAHSPKSVHIINIMLLAATSPEIVDVGGLGGPLSKIDDFGSLSGPLSKISSCYYLMLLAATSPEIVDVGGLAAWAANSISGAWAAHSSKSVHVNLMFRSQVRKSATGLSHSGGRP